MTIESSNRMHLVDVNIKDIEPNHYFSNFLMVRVSCKTQTFTKVDFKYTIFDSCYFRNCIFDECDFTGCRFTGSNFSGSKFSGCKFDYAIIERTQITASLLNTNLPSTENLQQKFARTLRTNFQSLGNYEAANKAISAELNATKTHLWKAAWPKESYYRKKYQGPSRISAIAQYINFNILHFIWGNGESIYNIGRTMLCLWAAIAIIDFAVLSQYSGFKAITQSIIIAPQVFMGIDPPDNYPKIYLAMVHLLRLVLLSLFISVLAKRLSRR